MPPLRDLIRAIESIAPPALAEPWDNAGLIVGDPDDDLRGPVLLAIDLTPEVADEAVSTKAGAVIAYHPPIFTPRKRLVASSPQERGLLRLIRSGAAVYSPHTALDAADGGLTDWLLDASAPSAITNRRALTPHTPATGNHKLVVFVPREPADLIDRLREALSSAGAGRIGNYDKCSFSIPGTGTFHGRESTNPAVGQRGRLESVEEARLEMVCPTGALAAVLTALRGAHPYEEPAFDVYPLTGAPDARIGAGRIGTLSAPPTLSAVAAKVRASLGVPVTIVGDPSKSVTTIAACPGSGASLFDAAASAGADVFITGEAKHHDALHAQDLNLALVLAGHTETERPYLPVLAERLSKAVPSTKFVVSKADRSPFRLER